MWCIKIVLSSTLGDRSIQFIVAEEIEERVHWEEFAF